MLVPAMFVLRARPASGPNGPSFTAVDPVDLRCPPSSPSFYSIKVLQTTASPLTQANQNNTSLRLRVLASGAAGQFVEFYDFAIYGFSIVVIAHLFFPKIL